MIDNWPTMSLREAGVSLHDCEHRTPPAAKSGWPYVGIPQVRDGRITFEGARRIKREHLEEWTKKANPEPFDVVLSRRCNPGETGLVPDDLEFALGQNLVLLRSDGTHVFKPFLRWLVQGFQWWEQVGMYLNVGAVFDSLKCADIPRFRLPIPPITVQRNIARVLGTLDDKIELGRRMNETLEALVRALFKSWFVDFDPVRAKMEGRDTGLPEEIDTQFPGRMENSEVGPLPAGWVPSNLADVAHSPRRGVDPSQLDPQTAYIGLEHMPRRSISLSAWGSAESVKSAKSAFKTGEFLFGKLRPYFHKVGIAPVSGICSTDIVVVSPKGPAWDAFVLALVSSVEFVAYTDQTSTGTKMPRTSWKSMASYPVALPPVHLAQVFEDVAGPLLRRTIHNVHQNRTLSRLRDALVPKLISGDLGVGGLEKIAT